MEEQKNNPVIEKEREAKALVSEEDFRKLQQHFGTSDVDSKLQLNHYFLDRAGVLENLLIKNGSTLRVREKGKTFVIQLKLENEEGSVDELPQDIDERIFENMKKFSHMPEGHVKDVLYRIGARHPYWCFGTLQTHRSIAVSNQPLLAEVFLDRSEYLARRDFEIEIESSISKAHATVSLQKTLDELGITPLVPVDETPKKIQRLYRWYKKVVA